MKLGNIDKNWDLVIIGGGVTGAGILREAVRNNLKTLLVEQKDYAWGTSSRSSKLVHGGLRYLKEGRFLLTRESVMERERLLREAEGLVEPVDFLLPIFKNRSPGRYTMKAGLSIYDLIAGRFRHKFYRAGAFNELEPLVDQNGLEGGFVFMDAQVDDARLVLRLINESVLLGGTALNYTSAVKIMKNLKGEVAGITLEDTESGEVQEVTTRVVINATGAWAEKLHSSPDPGLHLRPLRGSHIIFPASVIPINRSVSFFHPEDRRPLFIIPWEGSVMLGTTDIDHREDLTDEPCITPEETDYMIEGLKHIFPFLKIDEKDAISSFTGIRPVLSEGKLNASQESREHVVWIEKGLITITGGKLTTFRKLAWDTLKAAKPFLKETALSGRKDPVFDPIIGLSDNSSELSADDRRRLYGRYGRAAEKIINQAGPKDLESIPGTHFLWAELPYTAEHENIRHLTDLLLRRVRIGLLLPDGGKEYIARIQSLCAPKLPWDEIRWEKEIDNYFEHCRRYYSPSSANGA